jgi:DNA-nicking Smr family endonuclease
MPSLCHGAPRRHLASTEPIAYARAVGDREKHGVDSEERDDGELFRAAIGPVRRLDAADQAPRRPRPAPVPRMRDADERAALEASRRELPSSSTGPGDATEYRRNEVPPQVVRRLKRGDFSVQDSFDLHQLDAATAAVALGRFLAEARAANHRCVRIVHGKGLRSAQGPVLKSVVERALARRADVLAYASAPAAQGGTGAVLVLLAWVPKRGR